MPRSTWYKNEWCHEALPIVVGQQGIQPPELCGGHGDFFNSKVCPTVTVLKSPDKNDRVSTVIGYTRGYNDLIDEKLIRNSTLQGSMSQLENQFSLDRQYLSKKQ